MNHTVMTGCVLLYFCVLTRNRVGLSVVAPDMRLARTDRHCLFVAIDILVNIRSDNTVATEGGLIFEYICTGLIDQAVTVGSREGEETYAL